MGAAARSLVMPTSADGRRGLAEWAALKVLPPPLAGGRGGGALGGLGGRAADLHHAGLGLAAGPHRQHGTALHLGSAPRGLRSVPVAPGTVLAPLVVPRTDVHVEARRASAWLAGFAPQPAPEGCGVDAPGEAVPAVAAGAPAAPAMPATATSYLRQVWGLADDASDGDARTAAARPLAIDIPSPAAHHAHSRWPSTNWTDGPLSSSITMTLTGERQTLWSPDGAGRTRHTPRGAATDTGSDGEGEGGGPQLRALRVTGQLSPMGTGPIIYDAAQRPIEPWTFKKDAT
jgi:hypothetical protein